MGPNLSPSKERFNRHNRKKIITEFGIIVDRLQSMAVYVAVAEAGGFAAAARRLLASFVLGGGRAKELPDPHETRARRTARVGV